MKKIFVLMLGMAFAVHPAFAGTRASDGQAAAKAGLRCDIGCDDGGIDDGGGGGGTTLPPEKMTYFGVDPARGTIEMHTSRGVVVVIDDALDKVFLDTSKFHSEKRLSDVLLQMANGNASVASAIRGRLRAALSDTKRTAQLVPSGGSAGFAAGPGRFPRSGGIGSREGMMASGYDQPWDCYFDDYYSCHEQRISDFSSAGWGYYDFGFYTDVPAGGGGTTSDYNLWRMWVENECKSARNNALAVVGSILVMAESCEFSMTGVGAGVCYLGYVSGSAAGTDFLESASNCASDYPGPNNWGF